MTSKIKVDNIENQCGGAVVTKCGATTTISGSVVKADDIQAADGGNLINQCGTTITLGASGDTIALASGASQTGFGRTGTVDWNTTPVTSTPTTGVNGVGYFIDASGGAKTINLPASPTAGDIMAVSDYAQIASTNNITIGRNGSNIQGSASDLVIERTGVAMTLVYVDATKGWVVTDTGAEADKAADPEFITATGGTITCCGDFKIHTFTGPGTFTVCSVGNTAGSNSVDYLVVAGGGSAGRACGNFSSGGGGGGGMRISGGTASGCYAVSPLGSSPSPVSALPVTAQGYPITVGGGGSPVSSDGPGNSGSSAVFSTITSAGGGAGGGGSGGSNIGVNGGSGGGANNTAAGGTGNTPPVSPPQGQPGGTNPGAPTPAANGGAGGGGAGQTGFDSLPSTSPRSGGGDGSYSNINPATGVADGPVGSARYYAGGGGGGCGAGSCHSGPGGAGGGGAGLFPFSSPAATIPGQAGTVNTGGGGGGTRAGNSGGGGSGIVIIRYKFQ